MDIHHKPSGEVKLCDLETRKGLYEAVTHMCSNQAHVTRAESVDVWYRRLEHAGYKVLRASVQCVHGVQGNDLEDMGECEACELRKSTRAPGKAILYEERGAAKPLERVFLDPAGPMKHRFIGRARCFVTSLDSYSGYSLVRFVAHKSEAGDPEMEMVCELKNLLNGSLRRLRAIFATL